MVSEAYVYTFELHMMGDGRYLAELYRDGEYMSCRIAATKELAMVEIEHAKYLYTTTLIEKGTL